MKALILSAGQGRRLLPLTADRPKSSLAVGGKSLLQWQLDELAKTSITEAVVITGFAAEHLEKIAGDNEPWVRTFHNPFFASCDNLGTCWTARLEMQEPFLLLNGDTLFEAEVVNRLLANATDYPITLAVDNKGDYDSDDMKASIRGNQLLAVSKVLDLSVVNGESIGVMVFKGEGPALFCRTLDQLMRHSDGSSRWYLSAIDTLANQHKVGVHHINDLSWCEVDDRSDLEQAEPIVRTWPTQSAVTQST